MAKQSQAFYDKVGQIAGLLHTNPEYLLKVMQFESGTNPQAVNKSSGATGLIQFMPSTAKGLGTTTAALHGMDALQQLDYVYKYLQPYTGKLNSPQDAYMAVFTPAAIGKPPDYPMYKQGSAAYSQNAGLDINRDGVITPGEATQKAFGVSGGGVTFNPSAPPDLTPVALPKIPISEFRPLSDVAQVVDGQLVTGRIDDPQEIQKTQQAVYDAFKQSFDDSRIQEGWQPESAVSAEPRPQAPSPFELYKAAIANVRETAAQAAQPTPQAPPPQMPSPMEFIGNLANATKEGVVNAVTGTADYVGSGKMAGDIGGAFQKEFLTPAQTPWEGAMRPVQSLAGLGAGALEGGRDLLQGAVTLPSDFVNAGLGDGWTTKPLVSLPELHPAIQQALENAPVSAEIGKQLPFLALEGAGAGLKALKGAKALTQAEKLTGMAAHNERLAAEAINLGRGAQADELLARAAELRKAAALPEVTKEASALRKILGGAGHGAAIGAGYGITMDPQGGGWSGRISGATGMGALGGVLGGVMSGLPVVADRLTPDTVYIPELAESIGIKPSEGPSVDIRLPGQSDPSGPILGPDGRSPYGTAPVELPRGMRSAGQISETVPELEAAYFERQKPKVNIWLPETTPLVGETGNTLTRNPKEVLSVKDAEASARVFEQHDRFQAEQDRIDKQRERAAILQEKGDAEVVRELMRGGDIGSYRGFRELPATEGLDLLGIEVKRKGAKDRTNRFGGITLDQATVAGSVVRFPPGWTVGQVLKEAAEIRARRGIKSPIEDALMKRWRSGGRPANEWFNVLGDDLSNYEQSWGKVVSEDSVNHHQSAAESIAADQAEWELYNYRRAEQLLGEVDKAQDFDTLYEIVAKAENEGYGDVIDGYRDRLYDAMDRAEADITAGRERRGLTKDVEVPLLPETGYTEGALRPESVPRYKSQGPLLDAKGRPLRGETVDPNIKPEIELPGRTKPAGKIEAPRTEQVTFDQTPPSLQTPNEVGPVATDNLPTVRTSAGEEFFKPVADDGRMERVMQAVRDVVAKEKGQLITMAEAERLIREKYPEQLDHFRNFIDAGRKNQVYDMDNNPLERPRDAETRALAPVAAERRVIKPNTERLNLLRQYDGDYQAVVDDLTRRIKQYAPNAEVGMQRTKTGKTRDPKYQVGALIDQLQKVSNGKALEHVYFHGMNVGESTRASGTTMLRNYRADRIRRSSLTGEGVDPAVVEERLLAGESYTNHIQTAFDAVETLVNEGKLNKEAGKLFDDIRRGKITKNTTKRLREYLKDPETLKSLCNVMGLG